MPGACAAHSDPRRAPRASGCQTHAMCASPKMRDAHCMFRGFSRTRISRARSCLTRTRIARDALTAHGGPTAQTTCSTTSSTSRRSPSAPPTARAPLSPRAWATTPAVRHRQSPSLSVTRGVLRARALAASLAFWARARPEAVPGSGFGAGVYFNTAPSDTNGLFFGGAHLQNSSATDTGVGKGFLADADNGNGPTFSMTGSDQVGVHAIRRWQRLG